jgi:hypothetical protein
MKRKVGWLMLIGLVLTIVLLPDVIFPKGLTAQVPISAPTDSTATPTPPPTLRPLTQDSISSHSTGTIEPLSSYTSTVVPVYLGPGPNTPPEPPPPPVPPPKVWDHRQPFTHPADLYSVQIRAASVNLLVNGSFEEGVYSSTGNPTGWTRDAWNPSSATLTWDNTQAILGSKSVKIMLAIPNDARWIQTVTVQPFTDYRLSGWIKTENVAHTAESVDAGANLSLYDTWTHSTGLFGTNDWTFVSLLFNSGSNIQVTVAARLGYWSGTTTGTAWFDDLRLELLHTPTTYIQNPGFESGTSNQPDHWWPESIQGSSSFEWDGSTAHSGNRSVKVSASGQGIARWAQTALVDRDSEYELAGWIKTLNVQDPAGQSWTTGAKIGVYGMDSYLASATPGLRDTQNWTYVSVRFITGRTTLAKVTCTLGEADPLYARPTSSGTMWCDDLLLTKIRTLPRTYLSGRHLAMDIYTEDYLAFNDPVTYVARLDEVYEAMADLVGGIPFNGNLITVRSDASMYYGLLSGNPILIGPGRNVGGGTFSWADVVNRHGIDFGVPHELGHDFDLWPQSRLYMGQMNFDGAEHWANHKVLYAYDVLGARYPTLTNETFGRTVPLGQVGQTWVEELAQPWISSGRTDYQNMDACTALLYMLRQQVGWEPFKGVFREYGQLSSLPAPTSDEGKVELWANTLSRYARVDFIPSFQAWGFPVRQYRAEDVVPDCRVDILDIQAMTTRWRQAASVPYNLDGDERVAITDIMLVTAAWGSTCGISLNLVQNPSFEVGQYTPDRAPSYWTTDAWQGVSTFVWDNAQAHSGNKSVRIDSPRHLSTGE